MYPINRINSPSLGGKGQFILLSSGQIYHVKLRENLSCYHPQFHQAPPPTPALDPNPCPDLAKDSHGHVFRELDRGHFSVPYTCERESERASERERARARERERSRELC